MTNFIENYFKFIKRMIPSDHQGSIIGLDMGPGACKAVEIVCEKGSWEILRWKIEPVEALDEKGALARIVTAFGLAAKPRPLVTAVAGRGTLIRYIDMPRMPLKDLQRAFAIESEKYFPFPKDTVYTDCFILDPSGKDKRMSVLIAAVKKEAVDGRIKVMKEAGLAPDTVTISPIATANAFGVFPPAEAAGAEDKVSAIVDIGENGSSLMIMSARVPRFNRDIFIGIGEVQKRLSNVIGVPPAEARQILENPGTRGDDVQKAVSAVMANLISELRLSFDYFITEKNLQVGRIVLTGEGTSLPGVQKIFQDSFDIPLVSWDPFARVSLRADINKEELSRHSARLVTALGLALHDYDQA